MIKQKQTMVEENKNNIKYYIPDRIIKILAERKSRLHRTEVIYGGILFFDLVRFTNLTAMLSESGPRGAEKLHEIMTSYYDLMIDIIRRYGGVIYQFAGDSALASFEVNFDDKENNADNKSKEQQKEELILSVCSCAMEMKNALESSNLQYENHKLNAKFTISYGKYHQVLLGSDTTYFQVVLLGETIQRAVRAEALAQGGDILVAPEIIAALGENADVKEKNNVHQLHALKKTINAHLEFDRRKEIRVDDEALFMKKCANFITPSLVKKINTEQLGYIGEFRNVTSVFVKLFGIEYSENIKTPIQLLNTFFAATRELCETFSGTLIQTDFTDKGSVFLILFGAPTALENKEAMALRFALRLQETSQTLPFIENLDIGISTGPLYCGDVGSKQRKGYSVLGESVNMASRLMSYARTERPAIDERTSTALPKSFLLEEQEKVKFKGIEGELRVFLVSGETRIRDHKVNHSVLIGRKKELGWLKTQLDDKGSAGVGVIGEAGVGKSRLIYDFIENAKAAKSVVYAGTCYSYEKFTSYFPWKHILTEIFNIKDENGTIAVIEKIQEAMKHLDDENRSWAIVFARLLGETIEEDPFTLNMEPKKKSKEIFEITGQILQQKAKENNLIILFEDYHWIDEGSENLIKYIMKLNIPGVFFLAVSRPEGPVSELNSIDKYKELLLEEFHEEDATEYLRLKMDLAKTDFNSEKLERDILNRAHGNPFFLESIVYSLKERGILITDETGKRKLNGAEKKIEIPDSLQGVLLSRIDRLEESEKLILKNASVIGRLFAYNLLQHIAPDNMEKSLSVYLTNLEKNDFTLLESNEPLAYLFKHVLIRDVAYNSMLSATREALHNRLAVYLEGLGPEKIIENIDHLAYHYFEAKNIDKSIEYSLQAARNAASQYANADAIHHYSNIIDLIENDNVVKNEEKKNAKKEFRDLLYDVKIELGHVYRSSGSFAEAIDIFQEPLEMVKNKIKLAKIHTGLGQVYQEQGDIDLSMVELEKALGLLGARVPKSKLFVNIGIVGLLLKRLMNTLLPFFPLKASDKKEEIIIMQYDIMEYLAKIYFFLNAEKMGWANLSQVNLVDRLPNADRLKGRAYASLALIYGALGLFNRAEVNTERSRKYSEKSKDPGTEAMYLQRTGTIEMYRNNPAIWVEKLTRAVPLYERLGETWETVLTTGTICAAMLYLGDVAKGIEINEEAFEMATSESAKQFQGWSMSTRGCFNYILNRDTVDNCLKDLSESIEISLSANDHAASLASLRYVLMINIREERLNKALDSAKKLFEGLNDFNNIIPHAHAGYFTILETILFASLKKNEPEKEFDVMWNTSLKKLKGLGKKYPFLKGYAKMSQALHLYRLGKEREARKKIQEVVTWYDRSPNQWEKSMALYYGAIIDPDNRVEYIEKGIAHCQKNQYGRDLIRFKKMIG